MLSIGKTYYVGTSLLQFSEVIDSYCSASTPRYVHGRKVYLTSVAVSLVKLNASTNQF
jgi:hypothetical protein